MPDVVNANKEEAYTQNNDVINIQAQLVPSPSKGTESNECDGFYLCIANKLVHSCWWVDGKKLEVPTIANIKVTLCQVM